MRPLVPYILLISNATLGSPPGDFKDVVSNHAIEATTAGSQAENLGVNPDKLDLSGEWAVTWAEPDRKYEETVFMAIKHDGDNITGTAIDPDLIPAVFCGAVEKGKVTFKYAPERHPSPFTRVVSSTFEGEVIGKDSMKGTWQLDKRRHLLAARQRGTWTATRTASGAARTVTIQSSTEIKLTLSSAEYDLFFDAEQIDNIKRSAEHAMKSGLLETKPAGIEDEIERRRKEYHAQKASRQARDHYEVTMSMGEILNLHRVDWRSERLTWLGQWTDREKQLHQRQSIVETRLRENGYLWSLDENSRIAPVDKELGRQGVMSTSHPSHTSE